MMSDKIELDIDLQIDFMLKNFKSFSHDEICHVIMKTRKKSKSSFVDKETILSKIMAKQA